MLICITIIQYNIDLLVSRSVLFSGNTRLLLTWVEYICHNYALRFKDKRKMNVSL